MAKFDYDIAIIGGGAAGLTVASGAAQLGARTLLIEKERALGGDCLHYGCVPSKTLIKSAHVYHLMQRAERFGLPGVSPEAVDFNKIAARIREVVDHIQQHDSVERFNALGAEILFGEARFSDEHRVVCGGRTITAAKWLIATGSSPAVPPIPGLDTTPYLTNKDIFSLPSLPESLIVLGGGPIAMEMAQAFCRLGTKVTVLQRSKQILSNEDKDMADEVMYAMENEGVSFHLGCTLVSARDCGHAREVVYQDADGKSHIAVATDILVALGRATNTQGLGLEEIGVTLGRKGVEVDSKLRTSHSHIYAAGDVTGTYQFTHAAGYEGGIVVSNAIFRLPRKVDYTWMPWCTYTGPELASIGLNEKRAQAAGIEYQLFSEEFVDSDRAQAEAETRGRVKLLLDRRKKPLGVQVLGPHAGELLSEWIAILNGGVKLSTIAGSIHPYPTLAEMNKKVIGSIYSEQIFSDNVRKILKLLFRYQGSSV